MSVTELDRESRPPRRPRRALGAIVVLSVLVLGLLLGQIRPPSATIADAEAERPTTTTAPTRPVSSTTRVLGTAPPRWCTGMDIIEAERIAVQDLVDAYNDRDPDALRDVISGSAVIYDPAASGLGLPPGFTPFESWLAAGAASGDELTFVSLDVEAGVSRVRLRRTNAALPTIGFEAVETSYSLAFEGGRCRILFMAAVRIIAHPPDATCRLYETYGPANRGIAWLLPDGCGVTPEGRTAALGAWTGSEFIVVGGERRPFGEAITTTALAYNPDAQRWRALAPAPFEFSAGPDVAAWTGREVLIFGVDATGPLSWRGAGYDPGTDTWRVLPAPPIIPQVGAVLVWTGEELIVWGAARSEGAAYDPVSDSWRRIETPGLPVPVPDSAVATGVEVFFTGGDGGFRYLPDTGTWLPLPPVPAPGTADGPAVWTGRELVVAPAELDVRQRPAAFDPATWRWRVLPAGGRGCEAGALLGGAAVFRCGDQLEAYDPATDSWQTLADDPALDRVQPVLVWAEDRVFAWGGATFRVAQPPWPESNGLSYVVSTGDLEVVPAPPPGLTGGGDLDG